MRLPRELDPLEVRVLGCLLEKERITPDAYPLTLNSLTAAVNQKSNRDPVMELSPTKIDEVLGRLRAEVLVWPEEGARVRRWSHTLDRKWALPPPAMAVMAVLMLRGPQTVGELRARSERMHSFSSTNEVEDVLAELAIGDEPLAVRLPRRPGQKEARWTHLVAGEPDEAMASVAVTEPLTSRGLADRVAELEARVERLEELLAGRDRVPSGD